MSRAGRKSGPSRAGRGPAGAGPCPPAAAAGGRARPSGERPRQGADPPPRFAADAEQLGLSPHGIALKLYRVGAVFGDEGVRWTREIRQASGPGGAAPRPRRARAEGLHAGAAEEERACRRSPRGRFDRRAPRRGPEVADRVRRADHPARGEEGLPRADGDVPARRFPRAVLAAARASRASVDPRARATGTATGSCASSRIRATTDGGQTRAGS